MSMFFPLGEPDYDDADDGPLCVDCNGNADMFTAGEWICDACDDARDGEYGECGVLNPGGRSVAALDDQGAPG